MPNWNAIKKQYCRGGISYADLAKAHGVPFGTLAAHASRERWRELREKTTEKANIEFTEAVAAKTVKAEARFQSITDTILDKIQEGLDDGRFSKTARMLREVAATLKDLRDIKGYKTELDRKEQLARIKKLEKEAATDDTQNEIHVVIDSSLEDFAE